MNSYSRRVHITKATLSELGDKFDVEDGNGGERDEVLAKHNVETFLIIPPSTKTSSNSTKEVTKNLKLFRYAILLFIFQMITVVLHIKLFFRRS